MRRYDPKSLTNLGIQSLVVHPGPFSASSIPFHPVLSSKVVIEISGLTITCRVHCKVSLAGHSWHVTKQVLIPELKHNSHVQAHVKLGFAKKRPVRPKDPKLRWLGHQRQGVLVFCMVASSFFYALLWSAAELNVGSVGRIAAQDDSEKPSPQEDASVCSVAADFFLGHAKARLLHTGNNDIHISTKPVVWPNIVVFYVPAGTHRHTRLYMI